MSREQDDKQIRLDDASTASNGDGVELRETVISMAAPAPPVATQFAGWGPTLPANASANNTPQEAPAPPTEDVPPKRS